MFEYSYNKKLMFEIYVSRIKDWRWRLRNSAGEIVAISEGYNSRENALKSAQKIRTWATGAEIAEAR